MLAFPVGTRADAERASALVNPQPSSQPLTSPTIQSAQLPTALKSQPFNYAFMSTYCYSFSSCVFWSGLYGAKEDMLSAKYVEDDEPRDERRNS